MASRKNQSSTDTPRADRFKGNSRGPLTKAKHAQDGDNKPRPKQ